MGPTQVPAPPDKPTPSLLSRIDHAIGSSQTYKDLNNFGNNLGDSFAHHVASIPVGIAQLGMHGAKAVGDLVAPADNTLSGLVTGKQKGNWLDQKTAAYDKWVQDRESAYQGSVPDNASSYAGATIGEVLPWATGVGEARALGLLPTATKVGGKLGLLGAEGAAMGATQPVTNGGDNYAADKAKQVAIGAATGPVLYGLGAGAKAVGNVARHVTNPQAVADANIARLYGGDAATAQRLANAPALVPGEVPSAAQVLQTPEAVQAERMLRNNPASGPAFVAQDNANNQARLGLLQTIAGTDDDLAAAV